MALGVVLILVGLVGVVLIFWPAEVVLPVVAILVGTGLVSGSIDRKGDA